MFVDSWMLFYCGQCGLKPPRTNTSDMFSETCQRRRVMHILMQRSYSGCPIRTWILLRDRLRPSASSVRMDSLAKTLYNEVLLVVQNDMVPHYTGAFFGISRSDAMPGHWTFCVTTCTAASPQVSKVMKTSIMTDTRGLGAPSRKRMQRQGNP